MYTESLQASIKGTPCATNDDTIPARTSPLPPFDIPEFATVSINVCFPSVTMVLAPFRITTQLYCLANLVATSKRLD